MTGLYMGQALGGFGAANCCNFLWQTTFYVVGLIGCFSFNCLLFHFNIAYSTIICITDYGTTYKRGNGAKANTIQSQVIEIEPGTLTLNMRDNVGSFRSVATTKDMGET